MKRIIFLAVLLFAAAAVSAALPFRFPYSMRVVGSIRPSFEWRIQRTADDMIVSETVDHRRGRITSYLVVQTERGDAFQVVFRSDLLPGTRIAEGDTVGWIDSSLLTRTRAEFVSDRQVLTAELRAAQTGEKEELVAAAQERTRTAREIYEEQARVVERLETLQGAGFVSFQEYELAKSLLAQYRSELAASEAEFAALTVGARMVDIEFIRERIAAIDNNLAALDIQADKYTFVAPFTGSVMMTTSDSTLVSIADLSKTIAVVPISERLIGYLALGQRATFTSTAGDTLTGHVVFISDRVQYMQEQPVVPVTISFEDGMSGGFPFAMYAGKIALEPITIREHFLRWLRTQPTR